MPPEPGKLDVGVFRRKRSFVVPPHEFRVQKRILIHGWSTLRKAVRWA